MRFHQRSTALGKTAVTLLCVVVLAMTTTPADAATFTWSGGGFDANMDNGANWVGGAAPGFFDPFGAGDDIVFTGSTNTSPLVPATTTTPAAVVSMTFDSSASAFTLGPADDNHYLLVGIDGETTGFIRNDSTATQTLGAVSMYGGTITAANGPMVFDHPLNVGADKIGGGNNVTIQCDQDMTFNAGFTGLGSSEGTGTDGGDLTKEGQGTAYVTADSMIYDPVDPPRPWCGWVMVREGAMRVSTSLGLGNGDDASKCVISSIAAGRNGTLELTGDINIPKRIQFNGKPDDVPWVRNVSGNNTLSGAISTASGGGYYTMQSDAGKLTIEQDIPRSWNTGTRRFYIRGEGDGEIKGNIRDHSINDPDNPTNSSTNAIWSYIRKYGGGHWTFSGVNTYVGRTYIYGGTLALAGDGSIGNTQGVYIGGSGTFDVSGKTTEYVLGTTEYGDAQYIYGNGTVVGNVTVDAGASIRAGASVGQLSFQGDLTFQGDAKVIWEMDTLADDSTGTAGADFDQIIISGGDLDLGAEAELKISFGLLADGEKPTDDPLNAFWNSNHEWKIIDVDTLGGGTNSGSTNFASIVFSGDTPTGMTFDTYVGTGDDLGDVFLRCISGSLPPVPGDANGDRIVNDVDAGVLAANWGASVTTGAAAGDFNGDDVVNMLDASIMAANWGNHTGGEAAVPEPATLALLLGLLVPLALRRTRS